MNPPQNAGAQTVDRTVAILRELGTSGMAGLRLIDLQRITGLPKATVHRILSSLAHHGLVAQHTDTRRYCLGPEMAILGWAVTRQSYDLRDLCQPEMHALAQETGDTAFLTVRSGNDSVCIDRMMGPYPIKAFTVDVGTRRPLCVGAGGLALMACLTETEEEDIYLRTRQKLKEYPNAHERAIRAAVAATRAKGYALSDGHVLKSVRGLATAVFNPRGQPVGAISIAALRERISAARLPELLPILMRQRASIEKRIAAADQRPLGG